MMTRNTDELEKRGVEKNTKRNTTITRQRTEEKGYIHFFLFSLLYTLHALYTNAPSRHPLTRSSLVPFPHILLLSVFL